jgi:hypothetical protein
VQQQHQQHPVCPDAPRLLLPLLLPAVQLLLLLPLLQLPCRCSVLA